MALFINGVGQNSFSMNNVNIDNLYVDGVLVFSSDVETITMTDSLIYINGTNILVNFSDPLYQTANRIEDWELVLNGAVYQLGTMSILEGTVNLYPKFPITDYVTTVIVRHIAVDGNFGISEIESVNNSEVARANITTASTDEAGTKFILDFDRELADSTTGLILLDGLKCYIDGADKTYASKINDIDASIVDVTLDGQIYQGQTLVATLPEGDIQVAPFTDQSVTNNSTVTEITDSPPIYSLLTPLIVWGGFSWVDNIVPDATTYNGKLYGPLDAVWTPTAAEYPQDGTIDIKTDYSIDTEWVSPSDSEWTVTGVYDVDIGNEYKMYAIHYKGNGFADIYLGSSVETLALSETDKAYTPPVESWRILSTVPDIIEPPVSAGYDVYINFDDATNDPAGYSTNVIDDIYDTGVPDTFVDSTGATVAGFDVTITSSFTGFSVGGTVNDNCLVDQELMTVNVAYSASSKATMSFVLPAGTFTFTSLHSFGSTSLLRNTLATFDGVAKSIDSSQNNTGSHCLVWSNIVSDGATPILYDIEKTDGSQSGAYLNAMKITKA